MMTWINMKPQQKYRLGMTSTKLLGAGLNLVLQRQPSPHVMKWFKNLVTNQNHNGKKRNHEKYHNESKSTPPQNQRCAKPGVPCGVIWCHIRPLKICSKRESPGEPRRANQQTKNLQMSS